MHTESTALEPAPLTVVKALIAQAVADGDTRSLLELHNQADAIALYHRRGKAKDAANHAGEIKVRCERGLGQIDAAANKWGGPRKEQVNDTVNLLNTLRPNTRADWRRMGSLADAHFEELVEQARADEQAGISTARILEALTGFSRDAKERERQAKRAKNQELIEQAPSLDIAIEKGARFSTIVVDPPWDFGDEGDVDQFGRGTPTYQTISAEELHTWRIGDLADTDAHIYLWITNRSLPKGFALIETWGFRYVTCLTWVKPSFGMGNYFRGSTEQVLFGVRGSLPLARHDMPTHFIAERGPDGHSSKPPDFYDLIATCSPEPRINIFGKAEYPGWSSYGETGFSWPI